MNLVTFVTGIKYKTGVDIIKIKIKNIFNLKM